MLTTFISKILSGAIVGFITNDLAIQMLFRKRFGLGGIILKTREEFIENISNLVEREIINAHTLSNELNTAADSFEKALIESTHDFFEKQIFNAVPQNMKIGDIPQVETSFSEFHAHIRETLPSCIAQLLEFVAQNTNLKTIISDTTLDSLVSSVTKIITESLGDQHFLLETMQKFYDEYANLSLTEILSESVLYQLSVNISEITKDLYKTLQDHFSEEVEDTLHKILINLDTNLFFKKLAQQLAQKRIGDFLGLQETEQLEHEIATRLQALLHTENGRKLIYRFSDYLLESLENEQTTIFELMSAGLAENFDHFLKKQLPLFLERLISWLESRKPHLEQLIDTTFRSNIKWKFQDWLIQWFIGSISKHANAVRKIIETIDKHRVSPEETTNALTEQVITFLKNNTIGSISRKIRHEDSLNVLMEMLINNAEKGLKNLKPNQFKSILNQRISNFISETEIEKFLCRHFKLLVNHELKDHFLLSSKSEQFISQQIESEIQKLGKKTLNQFVQKDHFEKYAPQYSHNLSVYLVQKKPLSNALLKNQFHTALDKFEVKGDTKLKVFESLSHFLVDESSHLLKAQYEVRRGEHLHEYLQNLATFKTKIPHLVNQGIHQNLPKLLDNGQVAKIVASSLHQMDTSKLQEILKKFMGKELKPITQFGALLGGVTGGMLSFLPTSSGLNWVDASVAGFTFGITGYATNWLAIKMIFRPYQAKKFPIIHRQIPFTPGVVTKRQPRFAESMGKFVVNGLLNPDNLHSTFQKKKLALKSHALELFKSEDHQLIHSFLMNHKSNFAHQMTEKLTASIFDSPNHYLHVFDNWFAQQQAQELKNYNTKNFENQITTYFSGTDFTNKINNEISKFIRHQVESDHTLDRYITPKIHQEIHYQFGAWIGKYIEKIFGKTATERKIFDIFDSFDPKFQTFISGRISDYLNEERQENIRHHFDNYLHNILLESHLKDTLFHFIEEKFEEQLAPEKQINQLLNGRLMKLVADNLDFLVDNLIQYSLQFLKERQDKLAHQIYEKAYAEDKKAALYKSVIIDSVKELVHTGFPRFFENEKGDLHEMIASGVHQIGMSKIGVLNISPNKERLHQLVENFLDQENISKSLTQIIQALTHEIFQIPISDLAHLVGVTHIQDLIELLGQEIDLVFNHLKSKVQENQTAIGSDIALLLLKVLDQRLPDIKLSNFINGIPDATMDELIARVNQLILQSETFNHQKEIFVKMILKKLKTKELRHLVTWEELQSDLSRAIHELIKNPNTKVFFQEQMQSLIEESIEQLSKSIQPQTINFMLETLTDSFLSTIENNLHALLSSIDLRRLVVSEVNAMSPKEIEKLFNSFAERYFTQLIRYGFGFGIVFGLSIDLLFSGLLHYASE